MSRSFASASSQYLHTDSLAVSAYPLSVFVRFKPNATSFTKSSPLWSLGDKDVNNSSPLTINHSGDTSDKIATFWGNPTFVSVVSAANPVQDEWNTVIGIFESSSAITQFLNGVKARTTGLSGVAWNAAWDSTRVARWATNDTGANVYGDHLISDVAVWDVVLSDEEAASLNAGASPLTIRPANLKSYIPFLGRDSPEIDIVKGVGYTLNGSPAASADEPLRLWVPSKRRLTLPVKYGGQSLRFRRSSGLGTGSDDGAQKTMARTFAYVASSPISTHPCTMSVHFKNNDLTATGFPFLLCLSASGGLGGNSDTRVALSIQQTTNLINAGASVAGSFTNALTTIAVPDTGWHHAAGVFASATSRASYLDGANKGTSTTSRNFTGLNCIHLGVIFMDTGDLVQSGLDGNIAYPAIWNVALTDAEIAILAQGVSPLMVRPQNLVFYVPDFGRDSQPIDIIGGRKLTVVGATSDEGPRVVQVGARRRWFKTGNLYMLRYPNEILSMSGVTGAYTDVDESPDSPDANWLKR